MNITRSTGLSKCCWSEVTISGGEEGTYHYCCGHCGEACDLFTQRSTNNMKISTQLVDDKPTKLENISWKKELIEKWKKCVEEDLITSDRDYGLPSFNNFMTWLMRREREDL